MHREFVRYFVIKHKLHIQDVWIKNVVALISVDDIVVETFLNGILAYKDIIRKVRRLNLVCDDASCYVNTLPRVLTLTIVSGSTLVVLFNELKITRTVDDVIDALRIITDILTGSSVTA